MARTDAALAAAKNGDLESRAAEVITNLRKQVADLTVERDGATFERDGLTETADRNATARTKEGNLAATVITNLRKDVEILQADKNHVQIQRDDAREEVKTQTAAKDAAVLAMCDAQGERDEAWERRDAAQEEGFETEQQQTISTLKVQLDETRRARDLAQLDRHNLTEKLKYWENVAPNTDPELIVSTLMEERDAAQTERYAAEHDVAAAKDDYARMKADRNVFRKRHSDVTAARDNIQKKLGEEISRGHVLREGARDMREQIAQLSEAVGNAQRERDTMVQERDGARRDREVVLSDRDKALTNLAALREERNEDARAGCQARNERETAGRERDVALCELSESRSEVEQLDEELTAVRDASDSLVQALSLDLDTATDLLETANLKVVNLTNLLEATDAKVAALREKIDFIGEAGAVTQQHLEEAERRVDELIGEADTLTSALECAEEKLAARDVVREGDKPEPDPDPDDDPEDPTSPPGGGLRTELEASSRAGLRVSAERDDLRGKVADRLSEQRLLRRELEEMVTAEHHARTERDEARSNVDELQTRLTATQTTRQIEKDGAAVKITELYDSNDHLRKRLKQAIGHIDAMTAAVMDRKSMPTRPADLQSEAENTLPEAENPEESYHPLASAQPAFPTEAERALEDAEDAGAEPEATSSAVPYVGSEAEAQAELDEDANASACIQVWIAPAGDCPSLVSDEHGFAQREPLIAGAEIPPYCPLCNQPYTPARGARGKGYESGRRMTGG